MKLKLDTKLIQSYSKIAGYPRMDELAETIGINPKTISYRNKHGWTQADAGLLADLINCEVKDLLLR